MYGATRSERSEVNGDQSGAVDQLNHTLFGFGVVSRRKDDSTGFVRRGFTKPIVNRRSLAPYHVNADKGMAGDSPETTTINPVFFRSTVWTKFNGPSNDAKEVAVGNRAEETCAA
jgi:hypothetical protein